MRFNELTEQSVEESGLQYYTGVKKHGEDYMKRAAEAGRKGASQEELGRLKDKYSKAHKNQGVAEGRYDNRDAYQRDYDNSQTGFGRGERDSERHDIDTNNDHKTAHGTWYIRIDGIIEPTPYQGKAAANAAALELKKQPGNENKLFMLTTKA